MSLKQTVINGIIDREGGYVNDKSDSGGETNFGITISVARKNGFYAEMNTMKKQEAYDIYSLMYWNPLQLDAISVMGEKIAEELADTGVNMGIYRASEFLQRSLNVLNKNETIYKDLKVDGAIGKRSLDALSEYFKYRKGEGESVLFKMLNSLQGAFYIGLAERRQKDSKYIFGWFKNRIAY